MAKPAEPHKQLPPLRAELAEAVEAALGERALPSSANPGLVFARYACVWTARGQTPVPGDSEQRTPWLQDFVRDFEQRRATGVIELAARISRFDAMAVHRDYTCLGPLAIGLGGDHPLENGFSFEHTLGLPVLPGSSIKGLVRAGAKALGEEAHATSLLGSEGESGRVTFLAAWPRAWPTLHVDIVNPHHPAYLHDQGMPPASRRLLADLTEDPKPVCFLTVAHGTQYRFWLRWIGRCGQSARESADIQQVWTWLDVGLEYLGIGAKTAAGYGHMKHDS